jgi:hypothetical protein
MKSQGDIIIIIIIIITIIIIIWSPSSHSSIYALWYIIPK